MGELGDEMKELVGEGGGEMESWWVKVVVEWGFVVVCVKNG